MSNELEHQSAHLRMVLGAIPVGVVVVDQDLIVQAFNAAAEEITGVDAEEALGRPYSEVLRTREREIVDPLEEAMAEGKSFVNQRFYLRGDEDEAEEALPIRHSATLLTDEEGEVVGGVTVFADISRQVALERELEGQRNYLRQVLRSMPDGVATTDAELTIEGWNEAAERITGLSPDEVMGEACDEILGPTVGSVLETLLESGGGSFLDQRARFPTADGEEIPVGFSASSVVFESDHQQQRGIIVFRDISERLARQRELKQQRRYLEQILELAPYGILTVDREMTIQTFNQAAEDLTGYAASFAIGKPYKDVLKLDSESSSDPLPALVAGGEERVTTRLRLLDAGGKRIPIRYSAAPLTDTEDECIGAIVIFQDISDIVAAERTKNEFISMVSHELRTPLTSIRGFITALLDERAGEINERQRHFLSVSQEQSNQLLALINDLLDLTSLEAEDIELDRSRVSVSKLVQQAADGIRPLAEEKDLAMEVEIDQELPRLWADGRKLSQVLQNLLANAVKFTPEEGEITIAAELGDEDTVVLSVADTGLGIAPEEQERIFDPFYQVENIQTRSEGGTGLGLAIVKHIVEAHDGEIELESELGEGTTFRIILPLSPAPRRTVRSRRREVDLEMEMGPAPEVSGEPPPPRPERDRPLILVVEDDPATNELIQFLLEEEGYDVISASSGPEALTLAAERQPDLITLDLLMPEVHGFSALNELKKNRATANIPVCVVSIIEDKVKGYKLGAIDYVTKPFESDQLLSAVHRIFEPVQKEGERLSVLMVEDDPSIVELVEVTLDGNDGDYEVFVAHNGVAGLEKLRRHRPDLVLLDIMIPKLDGYDFIRQAKADPQTAEIPIIVLSVRSLEEDINRALRLGAEHYMVKASEDTEEDLSRLVERVVGEALENDDE